MSVFTQLTTTQVATWLDAYPLGSLETLTGIAEGVQNSNFFLSTSTGDYVLTIFEEVAPDQAPFYIRLMAHLAAHAIPCPAPVANRRNEYLTWLGGKPAVIVSRLAGRSERAPNLAQCAAVGAMLAALHLAARSFPAPQRHHRDTDWCARAAKEIAPFLAADDARLLDDELRHQQAARPDELPQGLIHADLFRDNVLFSGDRVSGVLDFYFSGVDDLLFDLAVTVNDCCVTAKATLDGQRCAALLGAYDARRPLLPAEQAAWPTLLRAAALRFWVSRLHDHHLPRPGDLVARRDPDAYRSILQARVASGDEAPWLASPAQGD
ncbi:MAG: homoserine kinase [Candidatus Accumulibacter regalis]|jgi:homoserine kinase (EC 2.7.1.39)|uniref:homoserine kinase n=1 Tax=Accumulibacter sp. TaxID=2053492 RepID=UPI001AD45ED1|nr:homoserine kinase [Accumulibacter sp.]MBN8512700.1 homoserine kinase [Accumulibacter sp.]MBO3703650.1 homoserine kinase [Accumulibacter sp.]